LSNVSNKRGILVRTFSERQGITPVRAKLQKAGIDAALQNGLWNMLATRYWILVDGNPRISDLQTNMRVLILAIWADQFKKPVDTIPYDWHGTYRALRDYFFKSDWYAQYNFVEFVANRYPVQTINDEFAKATNEILERELSAYRFVGGKITSITSDIEIAAIGEALKVSKPLDAVNKHLNSALALFSDKKAPDYANSVKESISSVEALCNLVTGSKNATLGDALDLVEKQGKVKLHPALKGAFDKLYGYASSSGGIRHGTIDNREVDFDIAKFMLVACSAFINYLISEAAKAGVKL
jgi:hypothetical protein